MFSTDHLPLAAYLTTVGYAATAVRNPNNNRVMFNFTDSDVEHHVKVYQKGKGSVEPGAFEQNRIMLRRQIERLQQGGG